MHRFQNFVYLLIITYIILTHLYVDRGGILQTVYGNNFESVYRAIMIVSIKNINSGEAAYVNETSECNIKNNTVMTCPSPDFSQNVLRGEIPGVSRNKRDLHEHRRQRRQTFSLNSPVREFYIGFQLDGIDRYRNTSQELGPSLGTIQIFSNPEITSWPGDVVFRPYKGEKHLSIKGQRMTYGCTIDDYVISIGDGFGMAVELYNNELIFQPPSDPPPLGKFYRDGKHQIKLTVGNINHSVGYMEYRLSPLDEPGIVAAIIACCIIAGIVIILLILYFVIWKHNGESPYKSLRRKMTAHENRYVGEKEEQLLEASVPVFNLMEQLKDYSKDLYANVMKVKIEADKMQVGEEIGKGNFGTVHQGVYGSPTGQKKVAIKTLRSNFIFLLNSKALLIASMLHHNKL